MYFLVLKMSTSALQISVGNKFILYKVCFQSKVMMKIKKYGVRMRVTLCNQSAGSPESFPLPPEESVGFTTPSLPSGPTDFFRVRRGMGATMNTAPPPPHTSWQDTVHRVSKSWTRPWRSISLGSSRCQLHIDICHGHLPATSTSMKSRAAAAGDL